MLRLLSVSFSVSWVCRVRRNYIQAHRVVGWFAMAASALFLPHMAYMLLVKGMEPVSLYASCMPHGCMLQGCQVAVAGMAHGMDCMAHWCALQGGCEFMCLQSLSLVWKTCADVHVGHCREGLLR